MFSYKDQKICEIVTISDNKETKIIKKDILVPIENLDVVIWPWRYHPLP